MIVKLNVFMKHLMPQLKLFVPIVFISMLLTSTLAYPQDNSEFKVGVLVDLSGRASYLGSLARAMAELAVEDLKKNNGIKIKLVCEDSASDTKRALSAVQKLLVVDNIDALYVETTPIATSVSPIVQAHKKILIYSALGTSVARSSPFAFKTLYDARESCAAATRYLKKQGIAHIGVLKSEIEPGERCADGVLSQDPSSFVITYMPGDRVASQVLQMKAKGIEAIVNMGYQGDIRENIRAMNTIKYRIPLAVPDDSTTLSLKQEMKDSFIPLITFGIQTQAVINDLLGRVQKKEPTISTEATMHGSLAYLHLMQLGLALRKCGKDAIECQVSEVSAAAPDPRFGFRGWRDRIAQFDVYVKAM